MCPVIKGVKVVIVFTVIDAKQYANVALIYIDQILLVPCRRTVGEN